LTAEEPGDKVGKQHCLLCFGSRQNHSQRVSGKDLSIGFQNFT